MNLWIRLVCIGAALLLAACGKKAPLPSPGADGQAAVPDTDAYLAPL